MVSLRKPALSLSSPWLRPICFRARRTRLPSCFGVRARSIIACLYARSYRKAIYGVEYIPQISAVTYKSNLYAEAHKRSEERRVGKESVSQCSTRWSEFHKKKK